MKKEFNKNGAGFTLIELLVVVAILGLLATIVAVSLTGARARARDGRRASDIRQVELALELYYAANMEYPDDSGTPADPYQKLVDEGYLNMQSPPTDPSTESEYCYAYGDISGGPQYPTQYYHVGALLENADSDLLGEDKDVYHDGSDANWTQAVTGDCATWGTSGDFDGGCDNAACSANPYGDNPNAPIYDRSVSPQ